MSSVNYEPPQTSVDLPATGCPVCGTGRRGRQLLPVVLEGENARLPEQKHRGDAGFDLYTSYSTLIEPGGFANVPTGVSIEMDEYTWGLIMGRSSTLTKRNLLVNTAVIDSGWRGELFAGVKNLGPQPVWVMTGERVAQFIPMGGIKADGLKPIQVEKLNDHERGTNGFGSTGI